MQYGTGTHHHPGANVGYNYMYSDGSEEEVDSEG